MRRFFLQKTDIDSNDPTITGPDVKHIRNVLRLKRGDEIALFDGEGSEYRARIESITTGGIRIVVLDKHPSGADSSVNITIGQALLKGRKADLIIRQLTELGVTAFLPFFAKRSVPKPTPKRMDARRQRWETIAMEALKQCGRSRPLAVGAVIPFERLLEIATTYKHKFLFHDDHRASALEPQLVDAYPSGDVIALIGPEGGFSDEELAMASSHGFLCSSLGPRTMKADTAAVAVATVLQYTLGDLGQALRNLKIP
jgi:16S rRNA (uracil1498-N3)-methyltransferase